LWGALVIKVIIVYSTSNAIVNQGQGTAGKIDELTGHPLLNFFLKGAFLPLKSVFKPYF